MDRFDQSEFNRFVLDNDVYGFFDSPITLKSGRESHFYVNWRTVVEDAWSTDRLIEFLLCFLEDRGIELDTIYGVPEGATKLGVLSQFVRARRQTNYAQGSHVLAMGRAKPKDHGAARDRFFVGAPQGRVVVIEDTVTTGGSMLKSLKSLQDSGTVIVAVVVLTDRMEKRDDGKSVAEAVSELGIDYHQMSTALDILPLAVKKSRPSKAVADAITKEFDTYGVDRISLTV